MDVITTHTQADLDGLGAMIAAKRLRPRAVIALPPQLNANVGRFVGLYREAFGMVELSELDPSTVASILLVDAQDRRRIDCPALADRAEVPWEIVDHHPRRVPVSTPGEIRPVGAATTLLVSRLRAQDVPLTPPEATAMLLGILEDTGRLSFPGTTPEDAEAVAYLLRQKANLEEAASYLDPPLSAPQQGLLADLVAHHRTLARSEGEIWLGGAERQADVPEQSLVAERLMALYRPAALVLAVRSRGGTQLTARSRDPGLDVRALLAPWQGAGHPTAATARDAAGTSPERILDLVEARLDRWRGPVRLARDVMSHPVRTLTFETTVAEAYAAMRRWGHSAMPVVHRGRPQGVISRRDLDRALQHGFADQPIRGLVGRHVVAVSPETPLPELTARMARLEVGRLLVMAEESLVGIVTRSDLIRESLDVALPEGTTCPPNLAEALHERWPEDWREALAIVGRLAGDRPLYLVGGAVRDLLLGHPSFDVDLLLEGDALALARDLARECGASVKEHAPFGTAHVHLPSCKRFDLATARIEHYSRPGALPEVSPSTVRQDLARRDFTVNALAMRLNPAAFGEVLDPFGGLADLQQRTLRVLHPLSFIEDPVRLFRAVRFEFQLGFRMDASTEAYGRYALGSGRFDGMGGERLKLELRRALARRDVAALALRLEVLDAWRMLHPSLALSPERHRALRRLGHHVRALPAEIRWLLALAILLAELDPAERAAAITPLLLRRDERHCLEEAWRGIALVPPLATLPVPSIAKRLDDLGDGTLCVMASEAPDRATRGAIARYARTLRALKLVEVDGAWLKAHGLPPGPAYRAILGQLLEAKRAGDLPSPADEARMAEELLREHLPVY